jgi:hypothetical protein
MIKKRNKSVTAGFPERITVDALPNHESDALCRVLIRSITEAFKNPKLAAEYKRWLAERRREEVQTV